MGRLVDWLLGGWVLYQAGANFVALGRPNFIKHARVSRDAKSNNTCCIKCHEQTGVIIRQPSEYQIIINVSRERFPGRKYRASPAGTKLTRLRVITNEFRGIDRRIARGRLASEIEKKTHTHTHTHRKKCEIKCRENKKKQEMQQDGKLSCVFGDARGCKCFYRLTRSSTNG